MKMQKKLFLPVTFNETLFSEEPKAAVERNIYIYIYIIYIYVYMYIYICMYFLRNIYIRNIYIYISYIYIYIYFMYASPFSWLAELFIGLSNI